MYAECCELIGLFVLFKLKKLDINLGLYRDDGLGASCKSKRQTEIIKKQIKKTFNDIGLKITIDANLHIVDFLDVTLDLKTGLHKPYMKPNKDHKENFANNPQCRLINPNKSIPFSLTL